ncbi:MAG: GHKL domain-containing protein [Myxococcaceae bacterium]|nr:GHKL domain-containing protein [Myxococcaceae bacterium]
MATETLFDELKRYVKFGPEDEATLRSLHPVMAPHFERFADVFYQRILEHDGARAALRDGPHMVDRLKVTLVAWLHQLLQGPWDDAYYERRCRIGRVHVRVALPQHYMFGAMNVLREQMIGFVEQHLKEKEPVQAIASIDKILDLELAIMVHSYREDLLSQQARVERLSTFGQLVGSIGHELRNPLGVIETSLYILKQRVSGDERTDKHIERIGQQLGIANAIITKLLDMIRDRPLSRETIAVGPMLEQACAAVTTPPEVQVQVRVPDGVPALLGDPIQLRQVFVNLIENAVIAASPKGEVQVVARADDATLQISVQDTGPGVDPSVRGRLFEPLVTTRPKGIGLGLALVKRIVERHGGSIGYQPRDGGGASFTVTLPLKAP